MLEKFIRSAAELRRARTLTTVSLLVALGVLASVGTIIPSEVLKIGLGFLVTACMGYLFGPLPAMLGALAVDLISYLLRPAGPYFFGFTLNALLTGLVFGLILYQSAPSLLRTAASKAVVSLFINVLLNTLWLSVLYGKAFFLLLPARFLKNLLIFPVEVLLLYLVLKAVDTAWRRRGRSQD